MATYLYRFIRVWECFHRMQLINITQFGQPNLVSRIHMLTAHPTPGVSNVTCPHSPGIGDVTCPHSPNPGLDNVPCPYLPPSPSAGNATCPHPRPQRRLCDLLPPGWPAHRIREGLFCALSPPIAHRMAFPHPNLSIDNLAYSYPKPSL